MPESAEELHARVLAATDGTGRLPVPSIGEWDVFPWEVVDGQIAPKELTAPVESEKERAGVDGVDCHICAGSGVRIWESDDFHVVRGPEPTGMPLVLWLNLNEHMDFTDLDDDRAAAFGRTSVWLARIMSALPHIGRVHVNRWGDGSEHMHAWFIARPARLPRILGSYAVEWDEILPPGPRDIWLEDCATVATKLANHAGRALV